MIKNEDCTLTNRKITNKNMVDFCSVFEDKKISYTCEILTDKKVRFTYNFFDGTSEKNPFLVDSFADFNIKLIKFDSEYCKLSYGEKSENNINFKGDENDEIYQHVFTKIESWKNRLIKMFRINQSSSFGGGLAVGVTCILCIVLPALYYNIALLLNNNPTTTIFSSIFLFVLLLFTCSLYFSCFLPYEIQIGVCKYKKYQKLFYVMLTSCVIPILIGILC